MDFTFNGCCMPRRSSNFSVAQIDLQAMSEIIDPRSCFVITQRRGKSSLEPKPKEKKYFLLFDVEAIIVHNRNCMPDSLSH